VRTVAPKQYKSKKKGFLFMPVAMDLNVIQEEALNRKKVTEMSALEAGWRGSIVPG
jgi:hypothetical protein